jgi:hypothetical protein
MIEPPICLFRIVGELGIWFCVVAFSLFWLIYTTSKMYVRHTRNIKKFTNQWATIVFWTKNLPNFLSLNKMWVIANCRLYTDNQYPYDPGRCIFEHSVFHLEAMHCRASAYYSVAHFAKGVLSTLQNFLNLRPTLSNELTTSCILLAKLYTSIPIEKIN